MWQRNGVNIGNGVHVLSYTTPPAILADNDTKFGTVIYNCKTAASAHSATAMLTVTNVQSSLAVSTTSLPNATESVAYSQSLAAAGGASPYSWSLSSGTLPTGLSLSSAGAISGSATVTGAFPFTVLVKDAAAHSASANLSITAVTAAASLRVDTTSLPNATKSVAYSQGLAASGGKSPYSWSHSSGSLPTGLAFASSGAISGTPTVAGTSPFTVVVKDSTGASASANLSINVVTAAPPTVSINSPANGSTVSGTVAVSGVASDGLTISSVQVSVDGGAFANASGTSSWSFDLNSNSLSNGAHTLSAKVIDSASNSATSSLVDVTVNNTSTSADCTLYASPSGNDSNSGSSPSTPKSFQGAANSTQPGSVVCLLGGTYNLSSTFVPPNSGSPSSWIVYKNYDSTPVNFVWTGAADASPMFKVGNGSFPSGPAYLEFQGLHLNGSGNAADGFFCRGGHHARFIANSISDTGGSGIGSINCDYLTADHNLINHNGYIPSSTSVPQWYSWTSAISFNSHLRFDNYPGIHSVISNNIIAGEVDQSSNHSDGNGIILDLGGNTPPALILNNVVYGNGGRCISPNHVQNFYIINNTCYDNALDSSEPNFPEFGVNGSSNGFLVNNIAFAVSSSNPSFAQYNSVSNVNYTADMYFNGSPNFSSSQLIQANPLFLSPPILAIGGFATALAPSLLGNALTLLPLSPAYGKGIDPSTLSGLPAAIASDLKTYVYTDINGKARPKGGGVDLGAYQH
jgi:hypothetical protein